MEINNEKIEQLADTAVKNPMKALFWILFIAISILGSSVLYMYKDSETRKTEELKNCSEERRALIDSLNSCKTGRSEDIRRMLEEANKKLEDKLKEQEKINHSK